MELVKILEQINLNLSKQSRKYQKRQRSDERLSGIFGDGVYRLYYDIESGVQIYPTRKDPKLKMDIPMVDSLRDEVEDELNKLGYRIINFEGNLAGKEGDKRIIRITKILSNYNNELLRRLSLYYDYISKEKIGEKLYVVISRHSHDIIGMSSKGELSSCEDLRDIVDIKDTMIRDTDVGSQGYGETAGEMIRSGFLIFYLVREGDWNIEKPLSRFADGVYCIYNSPTIYGASSNKFLIFLRNWLDKYETDILGNYNIRRDVDLFNKDDYELMKLYRRYYNSDIKDGLNKNYIFLLKGLINNGKYKVIENLVKNIHGDYLAFSDILKKVFGVEYIKRLPNELLVPIKESLKDELESVYEGIVNMDEVLYGTIKNTDFYTQIKNNPNIKDRYRRFNDKSKVTILLNIPLGEPMINELWSLVDIDKSNEIKRKLWRIRNDKGWEGSIEMIKVKINELLQ